MSSEYGLRTFSPACWPTRYAGCSAHCFMYACGPSCGLQGLNLRCICCVHLRCAFTVCIVARLRTLEQPVGTRSCTSSEGRNLHSAVRLSGSSCQVAHANNSCSASRSVDLQRQSQPYLVHVKQTGLQWEALFVSVKLSHARHHQAVIFSIPVGEQYRSRRGVLSHTRATHSLVRATHTLMRATHTLVLATHSVMSMGIPSLGVPCTPRDDWCAEDVRPNLSAQSNAGQICLCQPSLSAQSTPATHSLLSTGLPSTKAERSDWCVQTCIQTYPHVLPVTATYQSQIR